MIRTFQYEITASDLPSTVHQYLRRQGYSRHILASLKPHPDAVLRNGGHVWFSDKLITGDTLTVTVRDEISSVNIVPAPVPFSIVYEDEDLMVINKPAGVSIHPAINHPADTLANGIAQLYQDRGIPYVFRCINRLDRDTTGLLILANNVLSASLLEQALQRREISRTYLAAAEGAVEPEGIIDLPIGRKEASLIERCVDPEHGDRAVTHFRTLQVFSSDRLSAASVTNTGSPEPINPMTSAHSTAPANWTEDANHSNKTYSLVELHLETGRTHQIRVHMAAAGHPLLGDTLYNPRYQTAGPDQHRSAEDSPATDSHAQKPADSRYGHVFPDITRQALHAWKLAFIHPITKEAMQFTAPLPDDFQSLLNLSC
ncbi:MAG: RluA family pseudouridine synthase [Eubacterium sp.]|nr:RluA family pseudouridine synthase [Eubacterium sp.]